MGQEKAPAGWVPWVWGSSGEGAEVPLQPSECEPGLAGAGVQRHRGGRRKREPNRKEEAEMGVVRERERGGEWRARRCRGGAGRRRGQAAATGALHPKQSMEAGRGLMGREGRADGKGYLGNRAQLPPIPTAQMGRLRLETQGPLLKVTQPSPGS